MSHNVSLVKQLSKNMYESDDELIDVDRTITGFVHRACLHLPKDLGVSSNEELVKYVIGGREPAKCFPALSYFFKAVWKRCCELGLTDAEKVVVLVGSAQGTCVAAAVADFLDDSKMLYVHPHDRMEPFLSLLRIVASSPRRSVLSSAIRRKTRSMRGLAGAREGSRADLSA